MPSPYLIIAALLALIGAYLGGNYHGHQAERTEWTARIEKERADAAQAARTEEQAKQEKANAILTKQSADLRRINQRLLSDLSELRNRPERSAGVSEAPRASCAGGTGAELSRPDAEFLAGEAARADEIRAGLVACYGYLDALK